MFILCNFPAEFFKQKAVPGSFIMKGKEAFRGKKKSKQRLYRFNTKEIFQKFNYLIPHYYPELYMFS